MNTFHMKATPVIWCGLRICLMDEYLHTMWMVWIVFGLVMYYGISVVFLGWVLITIRNWWWWCSSAGARHQVISIQWGQRDWFSCSCRSIIRIRKKVMQYIDCSVIGKNMCPSFGVVGRDFCDLGMVIACATAFIEGDFMVVVLVWLCVKEMWIFHDFVG
jgi:hypothetical protein